MYRCYNKLSYFLILEIILIKDLYSWTGYIIKMMNKGFSHIESGPQKIFLKIIT